MAEGDHSGILDGGTFGFTLPRGWGWLPFVLGALMIIGGLVLLVPVVSALGALVMGFSAPSKLQGKLEELRARLRPADVAWRREEGGTELQSFWNHATVHRPTIDHRAWVFPTPGPAEWHMDTPWSADADGLLQEHPNRIGTPRPPMLSNAGVSMLAAFCFTALQLWILMEAEQPEPWVPYAMVVVGAIWLIFGIFSWKRAQAMGDTPTQNIRSAAVGGAELVGQVRPGPVMPPLVVVDGDASKTVSDLVSWKWDYQIEIEKTETYTDGDGNTKTRTTREWRTIRSDRGSTPFMVHDGSGGLLVHPDSFGRREYGDHLIQWTCNHDMRIRGLLTNLWVQGDVKRHRWTLHGLRISDPVYLLATLRNRSDAALEAAGIDRSIQNAILEAVGEKSVNLKPRLEKGTELTALAGARSQLENLVFPVIGLIIGIAFIGL